MNGQSLVKSLIESLARIEVHARDILMRPDIFGYGRTIGLGFLAQVAEGFTIRDDASDETRAVDIPAIMHFTPRGRRDEVKGRIHPERRDEKLVIKHTQVELHEGVIKRIITEKLTSEKQG